jgi:meso-butanediol dehydrogenase / (S,S)-butanediol dehydrogenase / diacetyl reductase
MRLSDKVAIVTGSARGIGQAIALEMAREGAAILVADVLDGAQTVDLVEAAGRRAVYVSTDLQEESQVAAMVARAESDLGGVDVLVNDAAVQYEAPLEELTVEQVDHMYRVNLRGVLLACKFAVPAMVRRGGGAIVNIASVMGLVGDPVLIGYSAMKGGVIALTKGIGVSFASQGIRCNAIAPADVDTYLSHKYWEQFPDPKSARADVEKLYPMKRFAAPEEIARIAVFLASDDSSFMTGEVVVADGGLLSTVYMGKASG